MLEKKLKKIFFLFLLLNSAGNIYGEFQDTSDGIREYDLPAAVSENPDELLRDMFGNEHIDDLIESCAIDFSKPPQPSSIVVLIRKIGTPLFLHYVTFYTYIRNWVRWLRAKASGRIYVPVGAHHYAQY